MVFFPDEVLQLQDVILELGHLAVPVNTFEGGVKSAVQMKPRTSGAGCLHTGTFHLCLATFVARDLCLPSFSWVMIWRTQG